MKTLYCAFNVTRQAFISLSVTVADTPFARLRGLIGKVRMRPDEALWVVPSRGIHTIGVRCSIDVIYLDSERRVLDVVESLSPLRIPGVRWKCASVLELPARSVFDSGTQVGDQLIIGSPEDLNSYWEAKRVGKINPHKINAHSPSETNCPPSPDVGVTQWRSGGDPGG